MPGVSDGRDRISVAGVLLAAGGSSRMGTAKQLLRIEGRSLVRRAAETALATDCDGLFAVIGAQARDVHPEIADLQIEVVVADDWRTGISRSIRRGIDAIAHSAHQFDAALVMLADQPDVTAAHLDRLIETFRTQRVSTVATGYADTVGVPALFGRSRFGALRALEGDRGAQSLLRRDPDVVRIPFAPAARDIDTLEDLE